MIRLHVRRAALAGCAAVAALWLGTAFAATNSTTIDTTVDWHQWQGPNRDGLSTDTGLLQKWPAGGPKLLWTGNNLGGGFSDISIQNGRIFTMGDRGEDQFVIALNLADGKELWSEKIGHAWDKDRNGPGPRCTPAADGQFVYALGTGGDLTCFNAATGKIQWTLNYKKEFDGKMMSQWGFSESPLVDGDRLICTPGGKEALLVALDKLTGKPIWKCAPGDLGPNPKKDGAGYSSVVISTGGGVKQYVQLVGKGLVGVRATDGKLLWHYNKMANGTANIPTPIVRGDYVFDSTAYGGGAALVKLSSDGDGVKADQVYFLAGDVLQNHHGGMVLVGDYLYGGHGQNKGAPLCIEFLTGKVMWREGHGPEGTKGSAAVGYADGKLYFRYDNGVMCLVDCTPDKFKEISEFKIPDQAGQPSWPHPVIVGGRLYLREQTHLFCYDLK